MTKTVTRYDLEDVGHYDDERTKVMLESASGEWVRYEDYASLQTAYEQMVRHHAKAHGVPVVEPRAECAQRDAREVVPAAQLPPELQEAAKEFAGLFGQKQATREVNCLWCDGTGKVTVSAQNRGG